eukprot:Gregarina_sp_Poly_1__1224@NODE_129_length_13257_cov_57_196588_g115_i0_p1_GENE_NODE_129_length_13257_cov_57_196588_g115_i0NODE_129_length_13257_cov_57_196588_g115_i0_p1_ORF_typecomplete_len793_score96_67SLC35F/PF06027_12/7_3e26CRTlike/PF08627_10/1_6e21Nuc_sug_transp/PF04142_15/5_2e20TPT/PF03151_16/2_6e11UAA/PF08449_11/2_6e10PUNUT/PF16913_5/1_1e07EamA/PF00892_20/4_2e05EamA/PF00892_20/1_1e03Mg_trans_NIPA/PF05653_14/4_5e02Mg_trans_NIPA/PF05653_14/0_00017DUF2306/PF10067_9/4_4e02DUF2306/PF10067_9/0_01
MPDNGSSEAEVELYAFETQDLKVAEVPLTQLSSDLKFEKTPPARAEETAPVWLVALYVVPCVTCGVITVIAAKWMARQVVPACATCEPKHFEAPCLQTLFMFLSESLCLVLYYADQFIAKRRVRGGGVLDAMMEVDNRRQCNVWWWVSPSFLDFIGTTLCNTAYTYTYASSVQLLRNCIVVVMALSQWAIVKRALKWHEWLGVLILSGGITLTAVTACYAPDSSVATANQDAAYIGVIFTVLGTCITSIQIIWEEFLYMKGYISPVQAVGVEGVAGVYFVLAVMPLLHEGKFEDILGNLARIRRSLSLRVATGLLIISAFVFNVTGLIVTRLAEARLRSVVFASRAPLVAIVEAVLQWPSPGALSLTTACLLFILGFSIYCNVRPISNMQQLQKAPGCCGCADLYEENETFLTEDAGGLSVEIAVHSSRVISYRSPHSFQEETILSQSPPMSLFVPQPWEEGLASNVLTEKFRRASSPEVSAFERTWESLAKNPPFSSTCAAKHRCRKNSSLRLVSAHSHERRLSVNSREPSFPPRHDSGFGLRIASRLTTPQFSETSLRMHTCDESTQPRLEPYYPRDAPLLSKEIAALELSGKARFPSWRLRTTQDYVAEGLCPNNFPPRIVPDSFSGETPSLHARNDNNWINSFSLDDESFDHALWQMEHRNRRVSSPAGMTRVGKVPKGRVRRLPSLPEHRRTRRVASLSKLSKQSAPSANEQRGRQRALISTEEPTRCRPTRNGVRKGLVSTQPLSTQPSSGEQELTSSASSAFLTISVSADADFQFPSGSTLLLSS